MLQTTSRLASGFHHIALPWVREARELELRSEAEKRNRPLSLLSTLLKNAELAVTALNN